jgi:hypothetical protein
MRDSGKKPFNRQMGLTLSFAKKSFLRYTENGQYSPKTQQKEPL